MIFSVKTFARFYIVIPALSVLGLVSCVSKTNSDKLLADSVRKATDSVIFVQKRDSIINAKERAIADSLEAELSKRLGTWKLENFTDEYGDPTGKKYTTTTVRGTFSNSATVNSDLWVSLILTQTSAGIFLHEYDLSRPAQKFVGTARIKMKNFEDKELEIFTGHSWNQNGGILIQNFTVVEGAESYDFAKFRDFIRKSAGEIKFIVYDKYSSTYRFDILTSGFQESFAQL